MSLPPTYSLIALGSGTMLCIISFFLYYHINMNCVFQEKFHRFLERNELSVFRVRSSCPYL